LGITHQFHQQRIPVNFDIKKTQHGIQPTALARMMKIEEDGTKLVSES